MKGIKGILLLGGRSERFDSPIPKQFEHLGQKKIYQHTLERLVNSALFEELILVCPLEKIENIQKEVSSTHKIVPGGETRQQSSYNGLLACDENTEIVLIHDGVRPFVSQRILEDNIEKAGQFRAVDTCIPTTDTLVYTKNLKTIDNIPSRTQFLRGQTPQTFSYPLILKAHQRTTKTNAFDDCSLVLDLGHPVHIVEGDEENIKITTQIDLLFAETLIRYTTAELK